MSLTKNILLSEAFATTRTSQAFAPTRNRFQVDSFKTISLSQALATPSNIQAAAPVPSLKSLFPTANWIYIEDVSELSSARHFELIPIYDSDHCAFPTSFYHEDTNIIQIRMGKDQHPSILVATYSVADSIDACTDFFELTTFSTALWYDGYDLRTRVSSITDMAYKIIEDRFTSEDPELQELLDCLGLELDDLDLDEDAGGTE